MRRSATAPKSKIMRSTLDRVVNLPTAIGLGLLAQTHRRRLILEVAWGAPLVGDGRTLGGLVHAPFGIGEIDLARAAS